MANTDLISEEDPLPLRLLSVANYPSINRDYLRLTGHSVAKRDKGTKILSYHGGDYDECRFLDITPCGSWLLVFTRATWRHIPGNCILPRISIVSILSLPSAENYEIYYLFCSRECEVLYILKNAIFWMWVKTVVSEKSIAFVIRVERINELGTTLAVTRSWSILRHSS
jgi:hypothetical protein